ncbi:hybrid sensor histidine kinase/response regulator [Pseudoalteromonas tetraodonis]|uniref:hybrid sensor histidine kinase/response regulator n=1 Tax=Pseudoalteromonas tetraodonis TaxID=43659 RepID=UPI000849711C|nr:ATP-binding protein [Pseudoalteromonas tetraodonis]ODS13104.1 hybrid sensor histidine kinase/response regulator [Pseudoalteromonas tetraodonis]
MNFLRCFHNIVSDQQLSFDQKIADLLAFGLDVFQLDLAIISRVKNNSYTVIHAITPDNSLAIGTEFELSGTYCTHTLLANSALAFHNASQSSIANHPCYINFQLEAYIGAPIRIGTDVFGTVNFSSAQKCAPFSDEAYDYIELLAQWLGSEFARNQDKVNLTKNSDTLLKLESVANIGTWEVDLIDNSIFWSQQTRRIHQAEEGYTPNMETAIEFYKAGKSRDSINKAVENAVSKGEKWHLELEIVTAKQQNIWVSTFGEAEFNNGKCVRLFGTFQDITEAVKLREELKQKKALAEQLLQDRSMLFAKISHELRTPLNGITGMLATLIDEHDYDKRAEKIKVALRSADILLSIINEVLDFSKINHGELKLEPHHSLLKTVFTDLVSLYSVLFSNKNIELLATNNIPNDVWVYCDTSRLSQIVSNLLSNALKFTEHGSVSLESQLTLDTKSPLLTIKITDTGRGMSKAYLNSLFKPFTQEVDANNNKDGTGLGLAIVKELVGFMNGKIEVTSEINVGTCFTLTIPIELGIQQKQTPSLKSINNHSNKLSVLVVDDNEINRLVLEAALDKFNIKSDFAIDGQDALLKCKQKHFDLIFMDCIMPIMDGFEATRQLKAQGICDPQQTYIVALTANASSQDKLNCQQAGMDMFIAKPFKLPAIEEAITNTLKRLGVATP